MAEIKVKIVAACDRRLIAEAEAAQSLRTTPAPAASSRAALKCDQDVLGCVVATPPRASIPLMS
jgi:hypothetical protein